MPTMFLTLLLLLMYTNMVYVTKIDDILTCLNDTDCSESIDSVLYTQTSIADDSASRDSSNYTEKNNSYITTTSTEITMSSNMNSSVTEQPMLQSTAIMSSPAVTPNDDEAALTFEMSDICECNLIKSACDINCCCDTDCNQFHLSAFSHCQDHHAKLYDSRYCYNRNFIQRNNTPFILEKLANNLFCILYDNLPSTYVIDNDSILQNENDLSKMIQMKKYRWKMEIGETLLKYNLSKAYQHGDMLWKLHDRSIEPIELLQSGFSGICSFKKIVKYLENWRSTCKQKELTNINRYLFPMAFNNITVISSLPSFNETFVTKQACQNNTCLSVRSHYCLNSFSICNETKISGFCMNSTCTNIVKGLRYIIVHNGSVGISSIDAYFKIGDASRMFHQYFEVQYRWKGSNETKVFVRSGNPGYIAGKPIIVGASRVNKSDEIFFNRTDGYLTLPLARKDGECDQIDRHIVSFGEDIKLKCSIKLYAKNFTALSCVKLQNLTMQFLLKDSSLNASRHYNVYISKLGNFTSDNIANWLRVLLDRLPQNIVTAHTVGKQILCSGLVTSLHLDILYSALSKPKTLTNYRILGIGATFGKEKDISWPKCTLDNCTNVLHVDIFSYVNFHDVTKPSKYYFVGGPNLDITLPYDFFYPFLNTSRRMEVSTILIFLTVCLILFDINNI